MIILTYISIFITLIYVISIAYVIVGWLAIPKKNKIATASTKKISVVIAYRNETQHLVNCLKSFEKQTITKTNFELILVNDHSEDNSKMLIEAYRKTSNLSILCYDLQEVTSKKEALTLGIKNASHSIIACTDADCIVPENWLQNISASFEENTAMLLGPVAFNTNYSSVGIFQTLDMLAIQGITFGMLQHQQPVLNNGANLAFLKKDFNLVGGYDQHRTPSGDDVFLLEKFIKNKLKVNGLISAQQIVKTQLQPTWKTFFQQRLRWASKSKYYSNSNLIYLSSIIYATNFLQIFIYLGVVLVDSYTTIGIMLLFSKWLIDFILLYLAAKFFCKMNYLYYVVGMQLIYPIYITMIGFLGMISSYKWKNRIYQ
ncbi:MAG: hypothetical protein CVT95_01555 [Bacteroidetes bacterium HGW-Bacteroidetes-12]|nr:MAG: hypothetical protein CVT95_01555 [Bacteroidetes bacterium HGW-Bacteroidetes-12]